VSIIDGLRLPNQTPADWFATHQPAFVIAEGVRIFVRGFEAFVLFRLFLSTLHDLNTRKHAHAIARIENRARRE